MVVLESVSALHRFDAEDEDTQMMQGLCLYGRHLLRRLPVIQL